MKKITKEEFHSISNTVEESLLKTIEELEGLTLPNITTECLDAYEKSKKKLKETFETHDTELIINDLINCLNLSEEVVHEIIKNNQKLLDSHLLIDSKCEAALKNADVINHIYANSIDKYTDKLHFEKGKGGRAGAEYKLYEEIIIHFIDKYLNSPRKERYTIQQAIADITQKIEDKDGTKRNISDSTFKSWKKNYEQNKYTIYKI